MNAMHITVLSIALLLAGPNGLEASTHGLGDGLTVTYKSPPAHRLSLESLDGKAYDLAAMKGRVVVINFWATWCPPCIEELPTMQKLWDETHSAGVEILAVNLGEPPDRIRAFLGGFEPTLEFPILLDLEGEAFQTWRVRGLPKTFVINKRGQIVYEAEGGRDMNSKHIRERLQELIDE
jgi:thiol-disulfide isomerase/thioredoxin